MNTETEINESQPNLLAELLWRGNHVRILGTTDTPLFIAKDICDILGLKTKHLSRYLDNDEVDTIDHVDSRGRRAEMLVLTESGLYHLILVSRKPEAKSFRRWITSEIMPAIRRQGYYQVAGIDPLIGRIHQGQQLALQAKQLQLRADELRAQADALLDFDGSATVQEVLISLGLPHIGKHLLLAANRMRNAAIKHGIPQGTRRSGTRTYPRQAIIAALGLDQLTLTLDNA
jgi:prophage antirepressor-like protein